MVESGEIINSLDCTKIVGSSDKSLTPNCWLNSDFIKYYIKNENVFFKESQTDPYEELYDKYFNLTNINVFWENDKIVTNSDNSIIVDYNEELLVLDIEKQDLKPYEHYQGFLFKNEMGVYNICETTEDIVKSNMWFQNFPKYTTWVSKNIIKKGDFFYAKCNNKTLHNKLFIYQDNTDLEGIIKITDIEYKNIFTTTVNILTNSYRIERFATSDEKKKIMNSKNEDSNR